MENKKRKREDWLLNESLNRFKRERKMNAHEQSMRNQYQRQLLQLQDAPLYTRLEMNKFNLATENAMFAPDFTWKIDGIAELLTRNTFVVESPEFAFNEYPDIRARAKLQLHTDRQVYVSLDFNNKKIENPLDFLLLPCVFYVVKDRSRKERLRLRHIIQSFEHLFPHKHLSKCTKRIDDEDFLTYAPYNVDDAVVLELYVEPPTVAQRVHSYDGTLNWTLDKCSGRIWAEGSSSSMCHKSPYFYTGPRGYRVEANFWFCGYGHHFGDGFSLTVHFLAGEFDQDLPRSFPHRTTVTLHGPERSVTKTVERNIEEKSAYAIDICQYQEMHGQFGNNTLQLSVVIVELTE